MKPIRNISLCLQWKHSSLIVASIFLCTGCQTDEILKATAKYASDSAKISEVYPAITNDFVESCKRRATFEALGESIKEPRVADRFYNERKRCFEGGVQSSSSIADTLNIINKLIVDYLKSLAGVAEANDYTDEIGKLAKSISGLPGMSDSQQAKDTLEASNTIASVLANQLTKSYRASTIREAVVKSDRALAVLTYSLSSATYYGYLGGVSPAPGVNSSLGADNRPGLARENSLLNNYYGAPIDASQLHLPRQPLQGFIEVSIYDKWIEEQGKLDAKRAVAHKYLRLLKDITCDHTALRLLIEKNTTTSVDDANQNCKEPSKGGLNVNRRLGEGTATLEDQLVLKLNSYHSRIEKLSLEYNNAFIVE
ncbi:hypothetical protein [Cyanobium gracile]|nr:hypothetical protein [Cyanobium gracile]